jgi:hypothetical protein
MAATALSVSGQTHFTFTSLTGNNMTVIVRTVINPTINSQPLASGDEIGVFTPAGLCVGARTWDSINNRAITVWGDNDMTPDTTGIFPGETLSYRIWDSSLSLELPATATYDTSPPATSRGTYVVNGISLLASLFAPPLPLPPVQLSPSDTAVILVDSVVFIWNLTTPFVDKYVIEIATDSLMSAIVAPRDTVIDTSRARKGLASGISYWWRVKAHNGSGWGNWSDTLKFTLASTAVALPKSYFLNLYSISGARFIINYALPAPSPVSIRIYSIQGKLIKTLVESRQAAGHYQIPSNLSALSKGFYILSFHAGSCVIRNKLVNF